MTENCRNPVTRAVVIRQHAPRPAISSIAATATAASWMTSQCAWPASCATETQRDVGCRRHPFRDVEPEAVWTLVPRPGDVARVAGLSCRSLRTTDRGRRFRSTPPMQGARHSAGRSRERGLAGFWPAYRQKFILALIAVFLAVFRDWSSYFSMGDHRTIMIVAAGRKQSRTIYRYCRAVADRGSVH